MKQRHILLITILAISVTGFVLAKSIFGKNKPYSTQKTEISYDLSNYVPYSETNLNASKQKGTTILFFAATTWCQSCSALEDEILKRAGELPSDTTILKVDYDNDKQMNQKYYVTAQHTLVVLDKNEKEITRWLGGDFDKLQSQIQKN